MGSSQRIKALLRLLFTLFLAAALHLALFFGVAIDPVIGPPAAPALQLTLTAPEPAKQTAPNNQPPAAAAPAAIKQPEARRAPVADKPPAAAVAQPVAPEPPAPKSTVVPAPSKSENRAPAAGLKPRPEPQPAPAQPPAGAEAPQQTKLSTGSLIARSLTLARSDTLDDFTTAPVGQRVKRLVPGKHATPEENSYLQHWRDKVQRIGARNYPESAHNKKLSGTLRLLVTLRSDGSLEEAVVLISSGNPQLDDAAIRIVKLAAPFRPFPAEMKKQTDRLEIVRTWKFENNTVVY